MELTLTFAFQTEEMESGMGQNSVMMGIMSPLMGEASNEILKMDGRVLEEALLPQTHALESFLK